MEKSRERIETLRTGNVSRALLKLGLPSMAGLVISALYNLIDTYFVGKLGTSQMGAVSIVYPLGLVILGTGLLFGSGASSHVSRFLGKDDRDGASRYASTALFGGLAVGLVLLSLMLIFLTPLLSALGATATMMAYAKKYAVLFISGLIFNLFNITFNNIIVAEGAARTSMTALFAGCLTNIILDPILIFTLSLGVRGAALATVISRIITFSVYLAYLFRRQSVLEFRLRHVCLKASVLADIFKLGAPVLMYQLLTGLALSLTNGLTAPYGDSAIAALAVTTRIMSLWSMAIFGFLKGYVPFAAFNFGAGKLERVRQATRITTIWSFAYCTLTAAAMIAFSRPLVSAFSRGDMTLIRIGRLSLILNALTFTGFGFQAVYSNLFIALGKAREGGLIGIGRQGLFFIPLLFLLSGLFKLNGIIAAQPVADLCSLILVTVLAGSARRAIAPDGRIRQTA